MKAFLLSEKLEVSHHSNFARLIGTKRVKKALFITAAAVPYGLDPVPDWLLESRDSFRPFAEEIVETSLEDGDLIPEDLDEYGFVVVSGGNTFYLAYRLKATGVGAALKEYIENDGVYIGISAGTVILADNIEPISLADDPAAAPEMCPGLGLLEKVVVPHADNKKYSEIIKKIINTYVELGYQTVAVGDKQACLVDGSTSTIID